MIGGFITCMIIGALCIVIGVINICGNINTLHSYHRHRVRPQDVKKLGVSVGIGMLFCGGGTISLGTGFLVFDITELAIYTILGAVAFVILFIAGTVISIVSICKYNKGLF